MICDDRNLWLPPGRLRRYQRNKVIVGLLMAAIFAGWLVAQWSNLLLRGVSLGLMLTTFWIVIRSLVVDTRRSRDRQVLVQGQCLVIEGSGRTQRAILTDVTVAHWYNQPQARAGLWFYDDCGQVLAHLDSAILADESEARAFLGWARQRADCPFEVRWPG